MAEVLFIISLPVLLFLALGIPSVFVMAHFMNKHKKIESTRDNPDKTEYYQLLLLRAPELDAHLKTICKTLQDRIDYLIDIMGIHRKVRTFNYNMPPEDIEKEKEQQYEVLKKMFLEGDWMKLNSISDTFQSRDENVS